MSCRDSKVYFRSGHSTTCEWCRDTTPGSGYCSARCIAEVRVYHAAEVHWLPTIGHGGRQRAMIEAVRSVSGAESKWMERATVSEVQLAKAERLAESYRESWVEADRQYRELRGELAAVAREAREYGATIGRMAESAAAVDRAARAEMAELRAANVGADEYLQMRDRAHAAERKLAKAGLG